MNLSQAVDNQYLQPGYHTCKVTRLEVTTKSDKGTWTIECDLASNGAVCKGKIYVTEKTLGSLKSFMEAIGLSIPNQDFPDLDALVNGLKPVFATVNKTTGYPFIIKGTISAKDGNVYGQIGMSPYNAKQFGGTIAEGNFEAGSPLYTKWVKASSVPNAVANSTTSAIASDDLPF